MGCDAVGWQGATTLRAYAREEKQRGQRAAARLNRVRSALTQPVKVVGRKKANIHAVYPAGESGQLPFLGLLAELRVPPNGAEDEAPGVAAGADEKAVGMHAAAGETDGVFRQHYPDVVAADSTLHHGHLCCRQM